MLIASSGVCFLVSSGLRGGITCWEEMKAIGWGWGRLERVRQEIVRRRDRNRIRPPPVYFICLHSSVPIRHFFRFFLSSSLSVVLAHVSYHLYISAVDRLSKSI